jgi:hypothetical protein
LGCDGFHVCATLKLQATGSSDTELSLGVQQFGPTPGVSSFLTVLNHHINFHHFAYLEHSSHRFTNHELAVLCVSTSARQQGDETELSGWGWSQCDVVYLHNQADILLHIITVFVALVSQHVNLIFLHRIIF